MKRVSMAKLFLDLLIIVCLGIAVWSGYILFTHQINPIAGTIIFLADIGVLIWNISVLRNSKYRHLKPGFALVFWSVVAITLVATFGGVQPLSTHKDMLILKATSILSTISCSGPDNPPGPNGPGPVVADNKSDTTNVTPPQPPPPPPPPNSSPSLAFTKDTIWKQETGTTGTLDISVRLATNPSAASGYYTIELISLYQNYDDKEFRYLVGNEPPILTWRIVGGETWIAIRDGASLDSVFTISIKSYIEFMPKYPQDKSPYFDTVEADIFKKINNLRTQSGSPPLQNNSNLYDSAKQRVYKMLKEGKQFDPLIAEITYSGIAPYEDAEVIATKFYEFLISNPTQRATILSKEYGSVTIAYIEESPTNAFYISLMLQ
ncbi:MAG: CAP domain-containing protein [Chloroflexota bacterium]